MNANAFIGWLIIFIIVVIVIVICFKDQGLFGIINAIFWLYFLFLIGYILYSYYILYSPNPNLNNNVDIVFENIGSYFQQRVVAPITKESNPLLDAVTKSPDLTNLYKQCYILGFPIVNGTVTNKWLTEKNIELKEIGEQKYYTNLRLKNIDRIKSIAENGTIIHEDNTLTFSVYNYNSFDTIEYLKENQLRIYTRDEWPWIIQHQICPWTRQKLPDTIMKMIKARNEVGGVLGNVFIYPLNDDIKSVNRSASLSDLNQVEGEKKEQERDIKSNRNEGEAKVNRDEGNIIIVQS
jgi:hypothetical protein